MQSNNSHPSDPHRLELPKVREKPENIIRLKDNLEALVKMMRTPASQVDKGALLALAALVQRQVQDALEIPSDTLTLFDLPERKALLRLYIGVVQSMVWQSGNRPPTV